VFIPFHEHLTVYVVIVFSQLIALLSASWSLNQWTVVELYEWLYV